MKPGGADGTSKRPATATDTEIKAAAAAGSLVISISPTANAETTRLAAGAAAAVQVKRMEMALAAAATPHVVEFNACYLNTPEEKENGHRSVTYIGSTPWPLDRLMRHNGEKSGGPDRTLPRRPWATICVVHGFATFDKALEFEAAWNAPYHNKTTAESMKELKSEAHIGTDYGVTRRLRQLYKMLQLPAWRGLIVSFTSQHWFDEAAKLPEFDHCHQVDVRSLASFPRDPTGGFVRLTEDMKQILCFHARMFPSERKAALGRWAQIQFSLDTPPSKASIRETLKRRHEFEFWNCDDERTKKREQSMDYKQVDKALANWMLHCQAREHRIPFESICSEARILFDAFAIDKASLSKWVSEFLVRHEFSTSASDKSVISPSPSLAIACRNELAIALNGVELTDVFWLREERVVFCELYSCSSEKRISMLLCVNADGSERTSPLIVGQKPLDIEDIPQEVVQYAWNDRAWLAPSVIRDWLLAMNRKMRVAGRRIVVLVDSLAVAAMDGIDLSNIKLRFISPLMHDVLAPLEARIVVSLKRWYRRAYLSHVQAQVGDASLNPFAASLDKAVRWFATGWQQMPRGIINQGFVEAGVVTGTTAVTELELLRQILAVQHQMCLPNPMRLDEYLVPRVGCDDIGELTDKDFADSGLMAVIGTGVTVSADEAEAAAQRLVQRVSRPTSLGRR